MTLDIILAVAAFVTTCAAVFGWAAYRTANDQADSAYRSVIRLERENERLRQRYDGLVAGAQEELAQRPIPDTAQYVPYGRPDGTVDYVLTGVQGSQPYVSSDGDVVIPAGSKTSDVLELLGFPAADSGATIVDPTCCDDDVVKRLPKAGFRIPTDFVSTFTMRNGSTVAAATESDGDRIYGVDVGPAYEGDGGDEAGRVVNAATFKPLNESIDVQAAHHRVAEVLQQAGRVDLYPNYTSDAISAGFEYGQAVERAKRG